MITRMSKNISSFFVAHGIIPADDMEVYEYGFEVLISTAMSFIFLAIMSIISGTLQYSALYLIGFVPLRLVVTSKSP